MNRVCYIAKRDEAVQELLNQVLIKPATDTLSAQLIYPDETIRADLHEYFRTFDEEAEAEFEAGSEPAVPSNETVSTYTTQSALASEFNPDQLPEYSDFLSLSLEQDPQFKFAVRPNPRTPIFIPSLSAPFTNLQSKFTVTQALLPADGTPCPRL
jgi:hypothetical protein